VREPDRPFSVGMPLELMTPSASTPRTKIETH
jgi:hypothetical protein